MVTLIIGGSCSGKSEYAEMCLEGVLGEKIYIATMIAADEESMRRVRRHRQRRKGSGFRTVECPSGLWETAQDIPQNAAVLLECIGNLAANEMFPPCDSKGASSAPGDGAASSAPEDGAAFVESVKRRILDAVAALQSRASELVIVSNEVNRAGCEFEGDTKRYQRLIGELNQALCQKAERVIEMAGGIPVIRKDG